MRRDTSAAAARVDSAGAASQSAAMTTSASVLAGFAAACADAGFDLTRAFATSWCEGEAGLHLPAFAPDGSLAVVVGNSRALWPVLAAALRRAPRRLDAADVVDAWAEETIGTAAAATGVAHRILWSHPTGAAAVPIQRLARVAGLAWLSPAHLAIHPRFGPWIGLRAVVVFALPAPQLPRPLPADPCGRCSDACLPAFRTAVAAGDGPEAWRAWLAARDACPLGREHRYDEDQIVYHYTGDRRILRRLAGISGET